MGWIIFAIILWLAALILVPLKQWKKSWPMGVFGLVSLFVIDDTLAILEAFRFFHGIFYLSNLPLFYILAYFPGGIFFDHFRPHRHMWRLFYIIAFAAVYLGVELFMIYIGYFQHLNWNAWKSLLLNLFGFTISMWFAEWLEQRRVK